MGDKKEKLDVKDKIIGDILDLSLCQLQEVPVRQIVCECN